MSNILKKQLVFFLAVCITLGFGSLSQAVAYDYNNPYAVVPSAIQGPPIAFAGVASSVGSSQGASKARAIQRINPEAPIPLRLVNGRSQIISFSKPLTRVSIANPALADIIPLAPDELLINGKQRGVTSLVVWDSTGKEGVFDLQVDNDTSEMRRAISAIAHDEAVDVRVTDDSVIVSGHVSSSVILDEIRRVASGYGYRDDKFVDVTDTMTPQVVLDVKILQMNRSVARQFKTSFSRNLATGNTSGFSIARSAGAGVTANSIAGGLLAGWGFGPNINVSLAALETEGKLTTLAEPKLISTHGREASFLAGGEFPFVTGVSIQGQAQVTYKEFGVGLKFTPWINVRNGLIELKIKPEVSKIDTTNCITTGASTLNICAISKRTTETTVQLEDGESLMLSGVLTKDEEDTFSKVPFAGDMPVLGNLFKNKVTSRADTELVIIVTPHMMNKEMYLKTAVTPSSSLPL
ncbi:MAG: pilus assembly protein N-terminal domain-containing protein [Vampirovibrionales bacterium]|nr:pilus assembly protein N-terminal domain-containing protein [Vampirovibrionales bacterium]